MKLNAKTKNDVRNTGAKTTGKKVAKVAKKGRTITGNYWKKLKELGSHAYGVKFYALRGSDYTGQTLTEWADAKGAERKLVLFVTGKRGLAMMNVSAKGSIVRVSGSQGFDTAQLKVAQLLAKNEAIKLVQKQGKTVKGFIYDKRTFNGHMLDNGEFYGVFTDGRELFECEAERISGKSAEQAKHVWALGGK